MNRGLFNRLKLVSFVVILLCLISFEAFSQNDKNNFHEKTNWILKTSVKNDALCLINTLIGDSFYLKYYNKVYQELEPKFTDEVRKSLKTLRKYKDENGLIVSALLTKWFFEVPDTSLSYTIEAFKNKSKVKGLGKIQKDLAAVIQFLSDIGFETEYKTLSIPVIRNRIDTIYPILKKHNIVPLIEQTVGLPLQSDSVVFYLVKYGQPHGINLSSNSFVSEISYNIVSSLQVAIHEMLHPYFNDNRFISKKEYNTLLKDSFINNTFINHDKSFGYNDFEGYINESMVRVLEQTVSDKLGLVKDKVNHWKKEDKGMHVFAAILYSEMLHKSFPGNYNGNFRQFLSECIADVKKEGGQAIYERLYQ